MSGKSKMEVENYCSSIGKECEFEFVEVTADEGYTNNTIIDQSIPANYDISLIYKPIVFKIAKVVGTSSSFDYSKCVQEEFKNNKNCMVPNFVDKNINEFNKWYKNFSYIQVKLNKIEDNTKTHNLITSQNIFGKSVFEIYKDKLSIDISYIYNNDDVIQGGEDDTNIDNQEPDYGDDNLEIDQGSNPGDGEDNLEHLPKEDDKDKE